MKRAIIICVCAIVSVCAMGKAPERGGRHFVDFTYKIGSHDRLWTDSKMINSWGGSYTYGRQLNSNWCVGVGYAFNYFYNGWEDFLNDGNLSAFYLDGRYDFEIDKYSPYVDLKVGVIQNKGAGMYIQPSVGHRWNLCDWLALNLGAGVSLINPQVDKFSLSEKDGIQYVNYLGAERKFMGQFTLSLGLEF